jgi:uncharacterized protein (DUF2141 family)
LAALTILFIAFLVAPLPLHSQSPARANLTVIVRGLRSDQGRLSAGLYDSLETFMRDGQEVATCSVPIHDGVARCVFEDVPPGRYAVGLMHDEDADGKFDSGFLGIPQEGYGFSRDARGTLGPPSFDAAAFQWDAHANGAITVRIRYGI